MKKIALLLCLLLTFALLLASCTEVGDTTSKDEISLPVESDAFSDNSTPAENSSADSPDESMPQAELEKEFCDGKYSLLKTGDERFLGFGDKKLFGLMGDTQIEDIVYYESVDRAVASLSSESIEIRISFGDDETSRVMSGAAMILFDNEGNIYTLPKDYVEIKLSAGDKFMAKDSKRAHRLIDKDGKVVSDTFSSFTLCACNEDKALYHIRNSKGENKAVIFDSDGNMTEYQYITDEHLGSYKSAAIKAFDKVIKDIKGKDRDAMAKYFDKAAVDSAFDKQGTVSDPTVKEDALAWIIDHAGEYLKEGSYDLHTECVHPDNGLKTKVWIRSFAKINDELTYEISFDCVFEYQDGNFNILTASASIEE